MSIVEWQQSNNQTLFLELRNLYTEGFQEWSYTSQRLYESVKDNPPKTLLDIGSGPKSILSQYIFDYITDTSQSEKSLDVTLVDIAYQNPLAKLAAILSITEKFNESKDPSFQELSKYSFKVSLIDEESSTPNQIESLIIQGLNYLKDQGVKINLIPEDILSFNNFTDSQFDLVAMTSLANYLDQQELQEIICNGVMKANYFVFVNCEDAGKISHNRMFNKNRASNIQILNFLEQIGFNWCPLSKFPPENTVGGVFHKIRGT